jgi:hypothetical protein
MTGRDWLAPHRRALQLSLGALWLLDAALQYQPYMFTKAFPRDVLAPAGPGNPAFVERSVHWSAHLTAAHVVELNAVFASVQLLIALGLFTRATVRIALVGSVMWGLGVWWMGEGFGGLLSGPQSPVMGAPGAAFLYAVIAILVWPPTDDRARRREGSAAVATSGRIPATVARLGWLALWGFFAFESLQAANRSPSALHDMVTGMQDGEPGWMQAVTRFGARALDQHGTEASIVLAILFAAIALSVFGGDRVTRTGLVAAVVVAGALWVFAQAFGEIATGEATDPNTGPLLVLLAAAYWPWRARQRSHGPGPGGEAPEAVITPPEAEPAAPSVEGIEEAPVPVG